MKTILGQLRLLAFLEGVSYLLLFLVTMPLKYWAGIHSPNQIIGKAHGVLFIMYCIWVLLGAKEYKWNIKTIILALVASLIPFGTFIADAKIFRKEAEF